MRKILKTLFTSAALLGASTMPSWAQEAAQSEAPKEVVAADNVAAAPAKIETVDVDPALWVVKDEDTTIYLFGTIHILKPGLGWFDDEVKTAFDKSDELITEITEPPAAQMQAMFAKYALDTSGKPLTSKLSAEEKKQYEAAMAKVGLPVASFEPFEIWAAGLTLQIVHLTKSGFDPNSGVEKQLEAAAKASKKKMGAVETADYQLGLFDTLPEANQIRFMMDGIKVIDSNDDTMQQLVDSWAKPDPEALAGLMNEGLTDPLLKRMLLVQRNANWAQWINKRMEKPGTVFFAVGAGHLAGETSVQQQLTAYGIKTERVVY